MFAQASARPIAGAVATLGVSDRVTFLRKTYAHLGLALVAFALITGGMMAYASETSLKFSMWAFRGPMIFLVMIIFMGASYGAQRLATNPNSRGLQYAGLGLMVVVQSLLLQPILWFVFFKFGSDVARLEMLRGHLSASGQAMTIILESIVITVAIFVGLTATVFLTKKDFSFLRGGLAIASFAVIGISLASWLFGFTLGAVFVGLVILLMAGYILYETSLIMTQFPPQSFVAAALMLFTTIATLFRLVLQLMASLQDRR